LVDSKFTRQGESTQTLRYQRKGQNGMQFIHCTCSEIPVFKSEDGRAHLDGGTQPSKPNSSRSVGFYARIKPSEAASKKGRRLPSAYRYR